MRQLKTYTDFLRLPSLEHRKQIARFQKRQFVEEEDRAIRGYVAWKRWQHYLASLDAHDRTKALEADLAIRQR